MAPLLLEDFHRSLGAKFAEVGGQMVASNYGNVDQEYAALQNAAGLMDMSFRSRLCLLGSDRQKFLNGQVTNNVKDLSPGQGIYAALITAKGKMQSDLRIYCLEEELLLDFEPGLAELAQVRLEKYIIADDVQVVNVSPHFGLLSIQGPTAAGALNQAGFENKIPAAPWTFSLVQHPSLGEVYLMNSARLGTSGFDLFIANDNLGQAWARLAEIKGVTPVGWEAFETSRIEVGIPRFGVDMTEANLPPEAGLDATAVSYTKGCYIGQEVIARIRTYGQVAKSLRGLVLADDLQELPRAGEKLIQGEREVGYITSATASPKLRKNIALGYVRREVNQPGADLFLKLGGRETRATVVALPFAL